MPAMELAERLLAATDVALLRKLGAAQPHAALDELLDEADIARPGSVPADLVILRAQVEIEDAASGRRQQLVLCEPAHAAPAAGCISVLSPVGLALLGLRVGAVARWRSPGGDECAATVLAVRQPQD